MNESQLKPARARGRPRGPQTDHRQLHVYLEPELVEFAKKFGNGNASKGVREALMICKKATEQS